MQRKMSSTILKLYFKKTNFEFKYTFYLCEISDCYTVLAADALPHGRHHAARRPRPRISSRASNPRHLSQLHMACHRVVLACCHTLGRWKSTRCSDAEMQSD